MCSRLPSDQKGMFISQQPSHVDWSHEQRLLEFFERAGSATENTKSGSFPVKIPSPRNTPAAATVPTPLDILSAYEPSAYRSQDTSAGQQDQFNEAHIASLTFRVRATTPPPSPIIALFC